MVMSKRKKKMRKAMKAGGAAAAGAAAGYGATAASGLTAVGFVGSGTGIGAPLGPVGMAAGAALGLALYGLVKMFD